MDYKEKLEEAKRLYETANADQKYVLESLFPELAGSEDEKVRKALIEMVHDTTGDSLWVDYNVHKEEALAWLEKQGEQKPANTVEPKCEESKTKIFDAPTPFEDKLYAFVAACEFLTLPAKIEFIKEHSQELLDAAKEQIEKKHEEDMELIKGLLEELNKKTFKPPFDIKTFPESKSSDQFKPFDPWGHTCVYACPPTPYDSNITASTTNTLNEENKL